MKRGASAEQTEATQANAPRISGRRPRADKTDAEIQLKTLVKPVSNAINILRYLSDEGRPATTTQIARQLHINASTCFNILRTMAHEGVLEFDAPSKSYRIGLELGKLAGSVLQQSERLTAVRPILHRFAETYGVTMALWRRIGDDRIMLSMVERSSNPLSIAPREGHRLPLLLGSTGRVVATQLGLSKREVQTAFKALRWNKEPDFEGYWEDALAAAERGWATDHGNYAAGIQTVAATVADRSGRINFSVVAFMFLHQFDDVQITKVGEALVHLGEDIADILY